MPVPYSKVPIEQLMRHEVAYNLIDAIGKNSFENWSIDQFEKNIVAYADNTMHLTRQDINLLKNGLSELDHEMPFLKFGEEGQHYAYELFMSNPNNWGSRGAPFFWNYVARKMTYIKLPADRDTIKDIYMDAVKEFDIPFGKDDWVYIERFAAGGMSSGVVDGLFAKEALDTILRRLEKYK